MLGMEPVAPVATPLAPRTLEGFLAALGGSGASEIDLARLVRRGLPTDAVAVLRGWGVTPQEIDALVIPRRTLLHRQKGGQRLSPVESDRVLRLVRMIAHAVATFGDAEKADLWLRRPTRPLGDEAPLALADTQSGADAVEKLLLRMDHGFAA
jgi:putative toxin-antitoxin system antitoxin component (TIGR02293 family)